MAARLVVQTFERYQRERVAFVQAVSEMAKSPQARPAGPFRSPLLRMTLCLAR